MSLFLGIDVGTSGIRTAVLDADGALISMARADHLPQNPNSVDAELWWTSVQTCVRTQVAALSDLGHDPAQICGVAVDGTSGTMVLTDETLRPVGPALMYNSSGFEAEADRIAALAPDPHITRGSNSALARAIRLASHATAPPAHLLHQADFIAAKLMGVGGHSDHNNALKTGFDPELEAWPEWISDLVDPALLPEVHAIGTPLACIAPDLARKLSLSEEVVVHAGTTDSIAAFLACAPREPGVAVTSLGSTLAIKVLGTHRIDDPEIGLYSHRLGDAWLVGGASNTGGAVLAAHFSSDQIAKLSAQMAPERATGLDYYPLLRPGERFPINDPMYPPRLNPRPDNDVEFLQAMFEAIARIEAQCYAEVESRGGKAPHIIYSAGGGASDPSLTKIRQATLGLPLAQADHTEASIGAARLALCKPP